MAEFVFLAAVPLALILTFGYALLTDLHPFDLRTFWQSGADVLHGRSPYPATLPQVARETLFRPFVYPAPAAVVMVPLAVLPLTAATMIWATMSVASLAGALYLLGVRDWRCYGAVFLWSASWSALADGSISTELLLVCAALWRFRSRAVVAGALLATLVVCKLYFWPVGVWLLATRRVRATVSSVCIAVTATLGAWAVIGFAGLREYPHLIGRLSELVGTNGYSPYALVRSLGSSPGVARLVVFALGAVILAMVVDRGRHDGGDPTAFVLVLAASLVMSPIVWPHYFVLVSVAIALASPTFGPAWLAPIAATLVMPGWSAGDPKLIGGTLLVFGSVFVWAVRRLDAATTSSSGAPLGPRRRATLASPFASPS